MYYEVFGFQIPAFMFWKVVVILGLAAVYGGWHAWTTGLRPGQAPRATDPRQAGHRPEGQHPR
jgi:hypothetical protein